MGLLDALTDPVLMAEIEERNQIAARLAKQMGVTQEEARRSLWHFDAITSSEGETLN